MEFPMPTKFLSDEEEVSEKQLIDEISRLVTAKSGVLLGPSKSAMVWSRIHKRIHQLGLESTGEYLRFLKQNIRSEVAVLISLLTTHHTFFFREFLHFEYLAHEGLGRVLHEAKKRNSSKLRIWSAACSRGHESYSLAMFLEHHLKTQLEPMNYEILGSDIDAYSVQVARNGVYRWEELKEVPSMYLGNHWARGTGEISQFVKAKDSLKSKTKFFPLNLKDLAKAPVLQEKFDIIFCRNVFIYFDPKQIQRTVDEMKMKLHPGGLLILGVSEPIQDVPFDLKLIGPSMYAHVPPGFEWLPTVSVPQIQRKAPDAAPAAEAGSGLLRVLCVDDSPTILALLRKILSKEAGFEVVATAGNGVEAAEALARNPVDLMTLDIHMPVQDGMEYLQKNMKPGHPPVILVTSVSREDNETAQKCLKMGATDFIEKPSILHLEDQAPEIIAKLRAAALSKGTAPAKPGTGPTKIEQAFVEPGQKAFKKGAARILVASVEDSSKVRTFLKTLTQPQPNTVVLYHGVDVDVHAEALQLGMMGKIKILEQGTASTLGPDDILAVGDFHTQIMELSRFLDGRPVSILVLGRSPASVDAKLKIWRAPQLIVEDLPATQAGAQRSLAGRADYYIPATSFLYHSDRHLKE